MTSDNLENLASIGKLKRERTSQSEFDGLVAELIDMAEVIAKKVEALGELT